MHCPECQTPLTLVGRFWICPTHGQVEVVPEEEAPGSAASPQQVFISYGREDALSFARRLRDDLTARGYAVWMDETEIKSGSLFEVRIEQGIRRSSVIAAVMSKHSVREESVCRDEVVFALNEGKTVVPLRTDRDPAVKPTLLLARRQWIDFTEEYDDGLAALVRYLGGDESALLPPRLPTITGVPPLDFGVEIARYSAGFRGREWLGRELDRWLIEAGNSVLAVLGEPGIGKSAIAAWLSLTREEVAAIHFCTQQNSRTLDPFEFVASLCGQLHASIPMYAKAVEQRHPEARRSAPGDALRELILEPLLSIGGPQEPRLIIVDGLDEAEGVQGETISDLLVRYAPDLPKWIRAVVTMRPEAHLLRRLGRFTVWELIPDNEENRADLDEFVISRLEGLPPECLGDKSAREIADRLGKLARGNFLNARMVLDSIEGGTLSVGDLGELAPGLASFYAEDFHRRFGDVSSYADKYAPILRVMVAAGGPLSLAVLHWVIGGSIETLHRHLLVLRPYLRVTRRGEDALYTLFHKSLRDWLVGTDASGEYWCSATQGHGELASGLLPHWADDEYALRYLPLHLIAAKRWKDLAAVLTDLGFLHSKISEVDVSVDERGRKWFTGVFALQQDFARTVEVWPAERDDLRRIVQAYAKAFTAVSHVLRMYPEQIVPQMYASLADLYPEDSEVMRHVDEQTAGRPEPWLRQVNCRMGPQGVATLEQTITRHRKAIDALAFTPDGRWVVVGDHGGAVRMWDASGKEGEQEIARGGPPIRALAVSPDGNRVYVVDKAGDFRIWDLPTMECVAKFNVGKVRAISALGNDTLVVMGDESGNLAWWNLKTQTRVYLHQKAHEGPVWRLVGFPDGCRFVSGGHDGAVAIWNGHERLCLARCLGHSDRIRSLAVSESQQLIASGSRDRSILLWSAVDGKRVASLRGHTSIVEALVFARGDTRLLSASYDTTIRLWDVNRRRSLGVVGGHERWIHCLASGPGGNHFASASEDGEVRLWSHNLSSDDQAVDGHSHWVLDTALLRDEEHFASASRDHTVRIWDLFDDSKPPKVLEGHRSWVQAVAVGPRSGEICSVSNDHTVRIWNLADGANRKAFVMLGMVQAIAASVEKGWLAAGASTGQLRILLGDESEPRQVESPLPGITDLAAMPGGERLLVRCDDLSVRLVDVASRSVVSVFTTNEPQRPPEPYHRHSSTTVGCSRSGRYVFSGDADGAFRVWDLASGQLVNRTLGHTDAVRGMCMTADDRHVITGSVAGDLHVWRLESGERIASLNGTTAISSISCLGSSDRICVIYASLPRPRVRLLSLSGEMT